MPAGSTTVPASLAQMDGADFVPISRKLTVWSVHLLAVASALWLGFCGLICLFTALSDLRSAASIELFTLSPGPTSAAWAAAWSLLVIVNWAYLLSPVLAAVLFGRRQYMGTGWVTWLLTIPLLWAVEWPLVVRFAQFYIA